MLAKYATTCPVDAGSIAQISPGKTRYSDLLEWFGTATSMTYEPQGRKTAYWRYIDYEAAKAKEIAVHFDATETVAGFDSGAASPPQ